MECYAVIGDPVAHSLSPVIHVEFAARAGKEIHYRQIRVAAADLESAARDFWRSGGRGLNVTAPHKEAALKLADRSAARARVAGAANWLSLEDGAIVADNTDGSGLVRDLTENMDLDLSGMRILLLGAGGAARGVLGPLMDAAPRRLTVANRTLERAHALVASRDTSVPLVACSLEDIGDASFDLILNATATGPADAPLDLSVSALAARRTVCYDLRYGEDTAFLAWARRAGCARVSDGLGMLLEQAAESFELWHGARPDTGPLRARLRAAATLRTL